MRVAFVYKKCLLDLIAAGHKFQLQSEHMTSLQERFVHVCEQEETSFFTCRDDTLLDDVLSGAMKQDQALKTLQAEQDNVRKAHATFFEELSILLAGLQKKKITVQIVHVSAEREHAPNLY